MPATRNQIRRAKVIGHAIDFGDGVEVTFWFDANKITDAWMAEWTALEAESKAPQMNGMLNDLIERWDILETEDGPVIPVSAEEIGKLFSYPAKIQMMREFVGLPSDAEGNASKNISASGVEDSSSTLDSPLNGQPTSPTPEPAASPSLTQPA